MRQGEGISAGRFLKIEKAMTNRIVMLVVSDGNDVRAHKEALALKEGGYEVIIVGRSNQHNVETIRYQDGIEIRITPQIVEPRDIIEFANKTPNISLSDRVYASKIYMLWRLAGLKFATAALAPPVLQAVAADKEHQSGQKQSLSLFDKYKSFVSRLSKKTDVARLGAGRNDPERFIRTAQWLGGSIAFRICWLGLYAISSVDRQLKRIRDFPITVTNVALRLMPSRYSKRIRARIVAYAQDIRPQVNYFLYYLESARLVRVLAPQVVHAHDLYMLRAAVKTAQYSNAKVIYDAHEYEAHRNHNMSERLRNIITSEEEKYVPYTDGVITVSPSIAAGMSEALNLKHVELIYNSPLTREFESSSGKSVRKTVGIDSETPLVSFCRKSL